MGWLVRLGITIIVILGGLFWWLFLADSDAPRAAPDVYNISDWRDLALRPDGDRPTHIRIIEVGYDKAPAFATLAGRLSGQSEMSYNAVEIVFPDRTIMIGGAADRLTAEGMQQSDYWSFDDEAYEHLTEAMLSAEQVLMTHEHLDHIMAIARHPSPELLAPRLVLNTHQIAALPNFVEGSFPDAYTTLEPRLTGNVQALAPGVVAIPSAGHTAGSQVIYIALADGTEILLIGDIVWMMDGVFNLKTRPVLTQYLVFDPNEDRTAVKQQVRALHDMIATNPDLIVLPSHDRLWLKSHSFNEQIVWAFP